MFSVVFGQEGVGGCATPVNHVRRMTLNSRFQIHDVTGCGEHRALCKLVLGALPFPRDRFRSRSTIKMLWLLANATQKHSKRKRGLDGT